MIETISFRGVDYPLFQSKGFAAQFTFPFAKQLCKGDGLDIGCMKRSWAYPNAYPIDLAFEDEYQAYNLPFNSKDEKGQWDYIFSSHCLEHLKDWVEALDYWLTCLKPGGVLYLYLPHYEQIYWRNWNNRKHIHNLKAHEIKEMLLSKGVKKCFATEGYDLNCSFTVVAEK